MLPSNQQITTDDQGGRNPMSQSSLASPSPSPSPSPFQSNSNSTGIKTAVVTGSSSGIGRAIAENLVRIGWRVVLHGRSRSPMLLQLKEQLDAAGGQTTIIPFDFASDRPLTEFVDLVWQQCSRVDAWINNAGGDVLTGDWASRSLNEKLDYLWQVDVKATLLLSRAVGAKMRIQSLGPIGSAQGNTGSASFVLSELSGVGSSLAAANGGATNPSPHPSPAVPDNRVTNDAAESGKFSILNMGWDQAATGMAGESGELFATTKGAIMAMTRSLAQSLAPEIRVNCVAPGWIQTEWGETANDYWDQRARSESLMNRWGRAEDVARLVAFLCSDQAEFISGQIIPVNGGYRLAAK